MSDSKHLGTAYAASKRKKSKDKVDRSESANMTRDERNSRGRVNKSVGSPEKGVNKQHPRPEGGVSTAGTNLRAGLDTAAKMNHKRTIEESRSMPKPKLQGLASGGTVKPISKPSMPKSSAFSIKMRDEEPKDDDINELVPMEEAEEMGNDGEPKQPEDSDSEEMYAEGGEVSADTEIESEQHDSISAAIMARREKMKAEIDSGAHDLDTAVKMAEGGQVDIDDNGEEDPNSLNDINEAALKENLDSDMDDISEPMESKGHKIDSDMHDMVDKIRKIVANKRK